MRTHAPNRIRPAGQLGPQTARAPSSEAPPAPRGPAADSHQHYCADHRPGVTPPPAPGAEGLCDLPAGAHKAVFTSSQPHSRPFELPVEKLPDGRWLVPIPVTSAIDGNGSPADGRNEQFMLRRYKAGSRGPDGRRRKHADTQRFLVVGGDGKIDHEWRARSTYCTPRGNKGTETRHTFSGNLTCDPRGRLFVKLDSKVRGVQIGAHIPG